MPLKRRLIIAVFITAAILSIAIALSMSMQGTSALRPDTSINQALIWVFTQQRVFRHELISALHSLREHANPNAGLWLILASFTYGIFHAAGPGHGKAVLSVYLLTNKVRMRRGIAIAVGGALCQGVTAITIVYGLIWILGWHSADTMTVISWSERLSYLLLAAVGIFWMTSAIYILVFQKQDIPDQHCHCHGPTPEQISNANSLRAVLALILAIGIRPCSGAVLVLIFAYTIQISWAGIVSALVMAIGTAITVSTLALMAVKVRDWAEALASQTSSTKNIFLRERRKIGGIFALLCGGLIAFFGCAMLVQTFTPRLAAGIL